MLFIHHRSSDREHTWRRSSFGKLLLKHLKCVMKWLFFSWKLCSNDDKTNCLVTQSIDRPTAPSLQLSCYRWTFTTKSWLSRRWQLNISPHATFGGKSSCLKTRGKLKEPPSQLKRRNWSSNGCQMEQIWWAEMACLDSYERLWGKTRWRPKMKDSQIPKVEWLPWLV